MDIILKSYANNTDKSVELAKYSINEWYKNNFSRRLSLIKSLTTIVSKLSESSILKDIENCILSYIYNNIDKLQVSDKELIEIISEIVEEKRPIEVSKTDIEALILLTLKSMRRVFMNSLFVNSLYIFEYESKMAKKIDFKHGINILTSDEKSGNDVGKSVLLKSIYHTLGADSIFDHMWNKITKTYILNVTIKIRHTMYIEEIIYLKYIIRILKKYL